MVLPLEIVNYVLEYLEWYEQIPLRRVSRIFNNTIINYRDAIWDKMRQKIANNYDNGTLLPQNHRGLQTLSCHTFSEEEKDSFLYSRIIWCEEESVREKLLIHWKGHCKNHRHYFNSMMYLPTSYDGNYYSFLRDFRVQNQWNHKKETELLEKKRQFQLLQKEINDLEIIKRMNR